MFKIFPRAVPFKSVGGGGTESFLKEGGGANSELNYPIRLHMHGNLLIKYFPVFSYKGGKGDYFE